MNLRGETEGAREGWHVFRNTKIRGRDVCTECTPERWHKIRNTGGAEATTTLTAALTGDW